MIDVHSMEDILLLQESEEVEFKKAAGRDGRGEVPDSFWETYSAMANTDGGYVFPGVAEKEGRFHFAGLASTKSLRKNIVDIANNPYSEEKFNHDRFKQLSDSPSEDLSRTLHQLIEGKILEKTGRGRNVLYLTPWLSLGSTHLDESSTHLNESSTRYGPIYILYFAG